jgi:hypothetical protein
MVKSKASYRERSRRQSRSEPFNRQSTSSPAQRSGKNSLAEELIDKTLADSFPASDPPSWTTGRERSGTGVEEISDTHKKRRKKRPEG